MAGCIIAASQGFLDNVYKHGHRTPQPTSNPLPSPDNLNDVPDPDVDATAEGPVAARSDGPRDDINVADWVAQIISNIVGGDTTDAEQAANQNANPERPRRGRPPGGQGRGPRGGTQPRRPTQQRNGADSSERRINVRSHPDTAPTYLTDLQRQNLLQEGTVDVAEDARRELEEIAIAEQHIDDDDAVEVDGDEMVPIDPDERDADEHDDDGGGGGAGEAQQATENDNVYKVLHEDPETGEPLRFVYRERRWSRAGTMSAQPNQHGAVQNETAATASPPVVTPEAAQGVSPDSNVSTNGAVTLPTVVQERNQSRVGPSLTPLAPPRLGGIVHGKCANSPAQCAKYKQQLPHHRRETSQSSAQRQARTHRRSKPR